MIYSTRGRDDTKFEFDDTKKYKCLLVKNNQ